MNSMNLYTDALIQMLVAKADEDVQMSEVFLVACGGSLVDLYPAKFFLASESCQLRSELYTANEFVHAVPKVLGERSVVILCSHSGDTPEAVEASKVAKAAGALTVTLTHNKSSKIANYTDHNIVYEWGDESSVKNNPMSITLALCLEIVQKSEGYANYTEFQEALLKIYDVVRQSRSKAGDRAKSFAETYQNE